MHPISAFDWTILIAASLAAGVANALAGGGTFMLFPALLFVGIDPIMANATASVITLPGGIVSAWIYRSTSKIEKKLFWMLVVISAVGSIAGSQLLLHTPSARFSKIVPYLMLAATLVFTFSNQLRRFAGSHSQTHVQMIPLVGFTTIIGIYGGYFGAGMGVLMIVLFLIAANIDVQSSASLRMWCANAVNVLATATFILRGIIVWRLAIPMLLATLIGGYWGAHAVKGLSPETARRAVLIFAWTMTAWLLIRSFQ